MTNKNENLETGPKTTSVEHIEDGREDEKRGFILIDKTETKKTNAIPEKTDGNKTDHSIDQTERYKFYTDKKTTKKHPLLIDEAGMLFSKYCVLDTKYPDITPEQRRKDLKDEKFIKEMDKRKELIANFGEKIGIPNLKERFINNDNIYLLPQKTFEEIHPDKYSDGFSASNEIFIKNTNDSKKEYFAAQHEMLHNACIEKFYLQEEAENYNIDRISSGYIGCKEGGARFLNKFGEGLVEVANLQICSENDIAVPEIGYFGCVVFITELVKDITQKIKEKAKEIEKENFEEKTREFIESIPQKLNGQKRETNEKGLKTVAKELTEEEILAHLHRGMFKGDRRYLRIIKNYYGTEAINSLTTMQKDKEDIIRVAKIFGLQTVIDKLNEFFDQSDKKSSTQIDIGKNSYRIEIVWSLEKFFITKIKK